MVTRLLVSGWILFAATLAWGQKLRVGQPFPEIALVDIRTHKMITHADFQGKVVIVDFWASWCGPCKESFAFYNKLANERQGKGLVIVGVNVDDDIEDAKKFAQTHPAQFTLVYDDGRKLTKTVGLATMPTTYIVDRKGRVTDIEKGFLNKKKDEITREVDRLLAKN